MSLPKPLSVLVSFIRDAAWLSPARARAWCRVLAVATAVIVAAWLGLSHGGVDRLGKPVGTDFISFWSASRLVLESHPAAPYDIDAHSRAQQAALATTAPQYTTPQYYAFFYPPVFLLLCLPLALLPYLASLAVWLGASLATLLACLRSLLPQRWAVLPILAFPGVLINAGHGQNGFVSASCLGGGMMLMQRRPFMAGMCLGVLAFKPHLALAVPVALVSARRWAAVAGAACSALGLVALSWVVLGRDAWLGFLHVAPLARLTLEQGLVEPWKMQSAFAAIRILHGGLGTAYAVQAVVTLGMCLLLARAAIRRPDGRAEGALTVTATLACTPFLLDYDLVCLALPMAWVAAEAQRTGWLPWEKSVLLVAYVLPLVSRSVAMLGVPLVPAVLVSLFLVVARRAAARPAFPSPSWHERVLVPTRVATWAVCTVATAGLAILLHATQTSLDVWSWLPIAAVLLVLASLYGIYSILRPDPLIATVAGGIASLTWAGSVAGIAALAGLRTGAPLIDAELADMDSWLGLDTQGFVAWTAQHSIAGFAMQVAYLSTVPLVFLSAVFLACTGRAARMWELCFAFSASAFACAFMDAFFPALGAFTRYDALQSAAVGLPANAGIYYMPTLQAFRSGFQDIIKTSHMDGVVVFPSFHAAMAFMVAFALRGLRGWSVLAWIWCGLTVAATVPIGGHYATDLIAGTALWAALAYYVHILTRAGTTGASPASSAPVFFKRAEDRECLARETYEKVK